MDESTSIKTDPRYSSIKWIFSVPLTPHSNGAIERLVALVKKALLANIPNHGMDDELLISLATKVESALNARPITYMSTDPNDPRPIRPIDFLLPLETLDSSPIPNPTPGTHKRRWNHLNSVLLNVWRSFIKLYTSDLKSNNVPAWHKEQRNLQVGDIVGVLDHPTPGKIPVARVTNVHTTEDGLVRSADILVVLPVDGATAETRTYRRGIQNLTLLLPSEN